LFYLTVRSPTQYLVRFVLKAMFFLWLGIGSAAQASSAPGFCSALSVYNKVPGLSWVSNKWAMRSFDFAASQSFRDRYVAVISSAPRSPLEAPKSNEEKLALIEALIVTQAKKYGSGSPAEVETLTSKQKISELVALVNQWNLNEGLSRNRLFQIIDAFFVVKNLSWRNLGVWKEFFSNPEVRDQKVLRQRWQAGLYSHGVLAALGASNLLSEERNSDIIQLARKMSRVFTAVFFLNFKSPLDRNEVREEVGKLADQIVDVGPDAAYKRFSTKFRNLARRDFYLKVLRTVAKLVLLGISINQITMVLEEHGLPIQLLWSDKEVVAQEMLVEQFEKEYLLEYKMKVPPELKKKVLERLSRK
jgi:hypothetical protein